MNLHNFENEIGLVLGEIKLEQVFFVGGINEVA